MGMRAFAGVISVVLLKIEVGDWELGGGMDGSGEWKDGGRGLR